MYSSQASLINKQSLSVLRQRQDGEFFIALEPLSSPIETELAKLEAKIKLPGTDLAALFRELKNDSVTGQIFQYHSGYSKYLDLGHADLKYDEQTLTDEFLTGRYTGIHLIQLFQIYILAFRLHFTYLKCQSNSEILAYSHRIVGWNQPPYRLSPDFSVTFRTNFAFGSASYFATVLTYREIDIVPFSKWVIYRIANQKEILRFSKWHSLHDESWFSAMTYVQEACNTYRKSETQFVKTYLSGECEKLISGLKSILINTKFRFITSWYHFVERDEEITLSGADLLVFRAQKISGSLEFISCIENLAHVIEIDKYIKQLEHLNTQFLPTLNSGMDKLTAQLNIFQKQLIPIQANYEIVKAKRDKYDEEKNAIRQSLADQGLPPGLTADHFQLNFPEYPAFEIDFESKQKLYYDLDREINYKNRALTECANCREVIHDYIANKNAA